MRIAVAGGTGQAGRRLVTALRERGNDVVVLSRAAGVDLSRSDGAGGALGELLAGVDSVVDASSSSAQSRRECVDFFTAVARNLQRAGAAAGVRRIVTLSIVGIDEMPDRAHYAGKRAQEAATMAGEVPWTVLRATQFHTFAGSLIDRLGKGPLLPCPIQPIQPVDLDVVVEHLLRVATAEAGVVDGARIDLAGPQRLGLTTAMRSTAGARGRRGIVVPLWLPGASERAARHGAALAPEGALVEGRSFDAWIEAGAPS